MADGTEKHELFTVQDAHDVCSGRTDLPPQLLFWLRSMPAESSWLEAPRPDWLLYLAELSSAVSVSQLIVARGVVASVANRPRQEWKKHTQVERETPLTDAAEQIRAILSGKRAA